MTETPLPAPRVAFSTLGCKVNGSESESFLSAFLHRGYQVVDFDDEADVYVINTCAVTHIADRKSRQEIRRAGRLHPLALVAATGCYVSVERDQLADLLPGNLLLIHNREKALLVDRVDAELALRRSCTASALDVPDARLPLPVGRSGAPASLLPVAIGADAQRTRATLKIQDGCNMGCSFCIIPRARGGPRSVPLVEAIHAAQTLETHGYREIVLTGILLGSYGRDLPGSPDLGLLVERLLAETTRLAIRLSSVEPQDLHPDWLSLWDDPRLCRHLHLPLQSGCDTTLSAMRRPYTTADYRALAAQAREAVPDLALTTDLMVGFPGEDEDRFTHTLEFAEELNFAGLHVFRYSPRAGTAAARLPAQVPEPQKHERSERLRLQGASQRARFHARYVGSTVPVLWERPREGIWHGTSSNHLDLYTSHEGNLHNLVLPSRLLRPYADGLWADVPALT